MQKIILAAVASNGIIGCNGKLPWHLPEDLKRFKAQTTGHTVIMGRKTYESIGKPLPNRLNVVVTRNWNSHLLNQHYPNLTFCRNLETAWRCAAREHPTMFVIGGSEVYRQSLPLVDEMRLTVLPDEYEGDVSFPQWPISDDWSIVTKEAGHDSPDVQYITYRRIV